jgi:hypothetical protein
MITKLRKIIIFKVLLIVTHVYISSLIIITNILSIRSHCNVFLFYFSLMLNISELTLISHCSLIKLVSVYHRLCFLKIFHDFIIIRRVYVYIYILAIR